MTSPAVPVIRAAARLAGFSYAIREIAAEARKVEATGRTVRYLNIGDPVAFGFKTPPHLVEAVQQALRDGHNGYVPSPGIAPAREAVAADYSSRGMPLTADRVVLTAGTSEGIELALTAIADPGDQVLVPLPTYPLYTAVLAKIGVEAVYYHTDPARGWIPDVDHINQLIGPRTRALVVIDPNNPTGAVYPATVRRELIQIADHHGFVLLADEVYGDLAYDGPVPPLASFNIDAPIISFSSLSKAYLAPGWRTGWLAVGRSPRLDDVLAGIKKLADGRLCSTGPMQYAVMAALAGDRTGQVALRSALRERAEFSAARLNAIPGITCVTPRGAFYAMPKIALPAGTSDRDYVVGLLHSAGILCVHGSGFGLPPADGFLRVVCLAPLADLGKIYDDMADFTRAFLGN